MTTEQLLQLLVGSGLLVTIIGTVIKGLQLLGALLEAKTKEVAAKTQNATLEKYITTAEDALWTSVMQLAQDTADDLKNKAADGKLTTEEQAELKANAKAKAIQIMGTEVKDGLSQIYADVEAWMDGKIDTYARTAKGSYTPAVKPEASDSTAS